MCMGPTQHFLDAWSPWLIRYGLEWSIPTLWEPSTLELLTSTLQVPVGLHHSTDHQGQFGAKAAPTSWQHQEQAWLQWGEVEEA